MDVPQAEIAFSNRLDVLVQVRVDRRLGMDAVIRPELLTDLEDGTCVLVPRQGDLTDGRSFQFGDIAADDAFGFAQSLRRSV